MERGEGKMGVGGAHLLLDLGDTSLALAVAVAVTSTAVNPLWGGLVLVVVTGDAGGLVFVFGIVTSVHGA